MKWFYIFVFYVASLQAQNHCQRYHGTCQADWMSKLPCSIQKHRLDQIKILGTHDSGAALHLQLNNTPPMQETPVLELFQWTSFITLLFRHCEAL